MPPRNFGPHRCFGDDGGGEDDACRGDCAGVGGAARRVGLLPVPGGMGRGSERRVQGECDHRISFGLENEANGRGCDAEEQQEAEHVGDGGYDHCGGDGRVQAHLP